MQSRLINANNMFTKEQLRIIDASKFEELKLHTCHFGF